MGLKSMEFRQIMQACQNHPEYLALTGRLMPKWHPIIINDVATDIERMLKEKEGITAKVITEYPIAELGVYGYRPASKEAKIFLDRSLPHSIMMPVGIHEALELARKAKRETIKGLGFIEGGFMQKPEEILIEHDVGKLLYSDINGSVSSPSKKDETKQLPSYHFVLQEHSKEIVKWIGKSSSNYDIFNIEVTVYDPLGQHYGTIILSNGHLDCLERSKR